MSEYVVVRHLPFVTPQHISGKAGGCSARFLAARRDSRMVEYALSRSEDDPQIVWVGDDDRSSERAMYAHSAAYTAFHCGHEQVLEQLAPEADPMHDLISDITVDQLIVALATHRYDSDLVRGLERWAKVNSVTDIYELRRRMRTDTHTVLIMIRESLTAYVEGKGATAEIVADAKRAAQMDASTRDKPTVVRDALFAAFRYGASADEFAETISAALEVVPTFIIDGEPVTELIQTMFPQRWMRPFYDPQYGFKPSVFA